MINKRQSFNSKYCCYILIMNFNQVITILLFSSFRKIG